MHAETGREDECETEPDARRGVREAGHRQVATRVQVSGWQRRDSPSSHACKHILRGDLGVSTSTRKRLVLPERPSVLHEASARGSNRFDLRGAMVLERRRLAMKRISGGERGLWIPDWSHALVRYGSAIE